MGDERSRLICWQDVHAALSLALQLADKRHVPSPSVSPLCQYLCTSSQTSFSSSSSSSHPCTLILPLLRSSLAPPAGVSLCTSGAAAALSGRTESVAPALLNARGLAYLTQTEAERAAGEKRKKTRRRRREWGREGEEEEDEHSWSHQVPPA